MNFLETHDLVISTLSPVHIGCGEDYEPTNYVVDERGTLHVLESTTLIAAGGEPLRQDIEKAMAQSDASTQLREAHAALKRHRAKLIPYAQSSIPLCKGVLGHYLKTQDARHDFNRNGIERMTYNLVNQTLYLPGSSIKGAIRTAWLNERGAGRNPLPTELIERIDRYNTMIEEYVLPSGTTGLRLKQQYSRREYDDARKAIEKSLQQAAGHLGPKWLEGSFETDPLRILHIGDTYPLEASIEREIRFCLNRSRSGRRTQAQGSVYTRLEYLGEHQTSVFGLRINLHHLENVVGHTDKKGHACTPKRGQLFDWMELVSACNKYYLPRLDNDLRLIAKLKPDSEWRRKTTELLDTGLRQEIEAGQCLLLRVGKHAGADSNTVDGRQINIMLNEDRRTRQDGSTEKIRLHVFDVEPRTSWFCGDDLDTPSDLMPHGWIVLSTDNRTWQPRMPGHIRKLERAQKLKKIERQAEEEAQRQRDEAERQARLASLGNQWVE